MRSYIVSTSRNLLRRPLVLGVPFQGLLLLSLIVLSINVLAAGSQTGNAISLAIALVGYLVLRILNRLLLPGWEEGVLFKIEKKFSKKCSYKLMRCTSKISIHSPDTHTQLELSSMKDSIKEHLIELKTDERFTQHCVISKEGAALCGIWVVEKPNLLALSKDIAPFQNKHTYSLCRLPVNTDPLWLTHLIQRAKKSADSKVSIISSFKGISPEQIKNRIEIARKSNAQVTDSLLNIDAQVSFNEASLVLEGISRGDESIVEASLVICSDEPLKLDKHLFCEEKNIELSLSSILGLRSRFHRSHFIKITTATDLVPNFFDPIENAPSILRTPKGYPLYFNPMDQRLEALHWLVVGASGSGKSFFTGLVLKRLIETGLGLSVLFVDHNRSFKRLVRSKAAPYLEPERIEDLRAGVSPLLTHLENPNTICGVELSNLLLNEKKEASSLLLTEVEKFLRSRRSTHPIYVVLDECWNFMRDEPVMVQRAFREFRKLNGAAIAITQSLSDFLTDHSGQSIFQNAPVRILLRQGEDIGKYQGVLSLNEVETEKVRTFRQEKGKFSECLIKTPFLSRIGRLYPTPEEYQLLRTDNLREELLLQTLAAKEALNA